MKVLLIEDEKAMNDLVAIKFRVEGFEVEQAGNFTEAKNKLMSFGPFDGILTDYLLPDGELSDFLTWLRSQPLTQALPVMVMTNYIEDVSVDRLRSLGVSEAVVKYQVVPAQMVEKMKQIMVASKTGTLGASQPQSPAG